MPMRFNLSALGAEVQYVFTKLGEYRSKAAVIPSVAEEIMVKLTSQFNWSLSDMLRCWPDSKE